MASKRLTHPIARLQSQLPDQGIIGNLRPLAAGDYRIVQAAQGVTFTFMGPGLSKRELIAAFRHVQRGKPWAELRRQGYRCVRIP